jgi:hypothetical protein
MATLIDWSQLETKVKAYVKAYDCENASHGLAYVVLEYVLNITSDEIADAITDGSHDRGIDAVYIDAKEGRDTIHLFQFKYITSFEKSRNNFPSSEIDKILNFIADLLKKDISLKDHCNELLWAKVQDIWDAFDRGVPSFIIHLAGNLQSLTEGEMARLETSLAPYRNFRAKHHTLESLSKLIVDAKSPSIDRDIRIVDDQYFERVDGNIRGLVATIQAIDLVEMIRNPGEPSSVLLDIFDDNVRVYLTSKNRINSKIIESALSDTNAEFWYLNNGITITCESMEYPPKMRAPLLKMKNVQIVNGGQTSNALFEAYNSDPDRLRNVLVLVRIYETRRREMSLRIAESTNSQTPIRSRDLRANDEVQRKLEESFHDLGYYYERKEKQHKDVPLSKRIDALSAGQAYVAYYLDQPDVAAKDRGKVFGDLYDQIFNDQITAQKLLLPSQIYYPIDLLKRGLYNSIRKGDSFDKDLLFLIDGSYHLLYTISLLCNLRHLDESNMETAINQLADAIKVVVAAVKQESDDPAFAHKRFFKSTRAKRNIISIAKELVEGRLV